MYKYQHIERFGTDEVEGIDVGTCYIFPKIDGTNGQLFWDDGIKAGSRNRDLTLEYDNQGFYASMINDERFIELFKLFPDITVYGEWLVPHALRTYQVDAWRKFYVFDVYSEGSYMPYTTYAPLMEKFGIDYIPPMAVVNNPSYDRLLAFLEKNTFLITDGMGAGEGIVIKNYEYRNKYRRQTWAKIVRNEFKTKHQKCQLNEVKEKTLVEELIVNKYITKSLVEKEHAKIKQNGWSSRDIPQLLQTVFHELITEESWNFVKEFKNPKVDFKRLNLLTTAKIKEHVPHLFN